MPRPKACSVSQSGTKHTRAYTEHFALESDRASNLPCRIHAGFEGLEVFFYNRTPAYDEIVAQLRNQQKQEPVQAPYPHGGVFEYPASRPRGFSLDDPEVHRNTRMTVATRDSKSFRFHLGPFG